MSGGDTHPCIILAQDQIQVITRKEHMLTGTQRPVCVLSLHADKSHPLGADTTYFQTPYLKAYLQKAK